MALAKDINEGRLTLPELDLPSDKDYVAVWALVDSGSSVHVVDASQVFPKSKVLPPPKGHKGFTVADGTKVEHGGFVHTNIRTVEGENKTIRWKNAKVAMPILSTHELARNGSKLEYDEDHGIIHNKATGATTKFYQAAEVYFVPLLVKKDILPDDKPQGFGRPG